MNSLNHCLMVNGIAPHTNLDVYAELGGPGARWSLAFVRDLRSTASET